MYQDFIYSILFYDVSELLQNIFISRKEILENGKESKKSLFGGMV